MSDDGGGGGGGGGFEDWDADFLDELIQVEELALSSSSVPNPTPNPNSLVHPRAITAAINVSYLPPLPPLPKQQQPQPYPSDFVSYSPPRELSQRPISVDFYDNNSNAAAAATSSLLDESEKDRKIDRLKRELGRVSNHLADLERECFHLKKVTSRREESIQSHAQQRHPTFKDYGATAEDSRGILQKSKNAEALDDRIGRQIDIATSSSTAIGVQTEKDLNSDLPSFSASKKLQDVWGSTSDPLLGGNLISKLFLACPSDFHILFGCMDLNMPSKLQVDSLRRSSSNTALQCRNSFYTAEATKVSNFYSALVKISNGLLQLDDFFETLFDLCNIENVAILSSSLHVLQVFLKHLLSFGRTSTGSAIYSGTMLRLREFPLETVSRVATCLIWAGMRHLI